MYEISIAVNNDWCIYYAKGNVGTKISRLPVSPLSICLIVERYPEEKCSAPVLISQPRLAACKGMHKGTVLVHQIE
jgi:hypothetical protein